MDGAHVSARTSKRLQCTLQDRHTMQPKVDRYSRGRLILRLHWIVACVYALACTVRKMVEICLLGCLPSMVQEM